MAANELLPTEWGGDIEVVKTSATTGTGIDELLETLLTVAELHDYKANPEPARASAPAWRPSSDEDRGVVAKLIVQNGTLHVGDVVVCGAAYGRVKAMYDTLRPRATSRRGRAHRCPVNVTGLDVAPGAGEHFYVLDDIATARADRRSRARPRARQRRSAAAPPARHAGKPVRPARSARRDVQTLNIILRADVRGSIEAIQKELTKLEHPEVKIKLLQATVGGITEADVHLADASDAIIIGFNVVPDEKARAAGRASAACRFAATTSSTR